MKSFFMPQTGIEPVLDIKHNIFCFLRIHILISDIDCDSRILIQSIFYKICLTRIIILAVSKSKYTQTARDSIKIYTVSSDITSSLSYSLDNLIETDTFPTLSTGNLKKVLVTQTVIDQEVKKIVNKC